MAKKRMKEYSPIEYGFRGTWETFAAEAYKVLKSQFKDRSLDDLMLNPTDAIVFCNMIRACLCQIGGRAGEMPEEFILRSMLNLRKNSKRNTTT